MRNKQFHFFLLELTLSLIILIVSLGVAFTLFTTSAARHQETEVLRKLSETMVLKAEELRNPLTLWPTESGSKSLTSTYDALGNPSSTKIKYTLTITTESTSILHKADLRLSDQQNKALIHLKVNALVRSVP